MKSTKKLVRRMILLATLFVAFFAMGIVGEAAAKKSTVPKKVRIYVDSVDTDAIQVLYAKEKYQIKNLKTNSKKLIAKQSYQSYEISNDGESDNSAEISLYAKKQGSYKVTFDICDEKGNVVEKKVTVQVFAKNDSPFKKVTYNGKSSIEYYTTKSSVKFKVAMNKGYKLKKIEYSVNNISKDEWEDGYNCYTDTTWKTIKNGGKVTLNKYGYIYASRYSYGTPGDGYYYLNDHWSDEMVADTMIRVTYIDKYTKEEATSTFWVGRLCLDNYKVK